MDQNRVFVNRYELNTLIGSGGMAEVYLGRDTRLNRDVAIKVLRSTLTHDPIFLTRFRKEAVSSASLNHPNIVSVYDSGDEVFVDDSGTVVHQPFIVMEYVQGKTLKDILSVQGKLSVEDSIQILLEVLKGLEYSHEHGIIHRDIKPANIMISSNGDVKVMDFGIARAIADVSSSLTQTQAVVGTAQYFSPEQAKGEKVDARSDLYSVGCVFYEMLAGKPPFTGESAVAVAYKHVLEKAELPSTINPGVTPVIDKLVMKSVQKDPKKRFQSAAEFILAAKNAEKGISVQPDTDETRTAVLLPEETEIIGAAAVGGAAGAAATAVMPAAANEGLQLNDTATDHAAVVPGEKEPMDKRLKMGLLIGGPALALILLAIVLVIIFKSFASADPDQVEVPDLSLAQNSTQACKILQAVSLVCDLTITSDPEVEAGKFIMQDPIAGEIVELDSIVKVYFSDGADSFKMVDFENMSVEEAERRLEELGLLLGLLKTDDSQTVAKDMVARTEPKAGATVSRGDTIDIYVSSGSVKLPNLVGKTIAEAEELLNEVGLSASIIDVQSDKKEGTVVEQDPKAGTVPQGSQVRLGVAVNNKVAVPSLGGLTQAQAYDTLRDVGLYGTFVYQPNDSVGSDRVIGSDPAAGTMVNKGVTITVFISSGPTPPPPDGGGG